MSSDLHQLSQTTKKYDIPLCHLDYNYIDKCTNVKELEKIVFVLRSGEEGKFPDLERYAENRLQELNPKSRTLRKEGPILRPADLSSGDWQSIEEDLKSWTNTMHHQDSNKQNAHPASSSDIVEGDEHLPPVRSSNVVLEGKKQKNPSAEKKNKRVLPRDYKEWDKVDVDAELEKVDKEEKNISTSEKSKLSGVTLDINATGLSEEQKQIKANREKDKGNEAFRSHDYDESVTYYSRSISLSPLAASYNNRALAYLKLEKWDKAIKDCNSVLNLEIDNIKALLRRGTAYKSKKNHSKAMADFEKVLKLEPQNKKAEDLLQETQSQNKKEEKERKEKGRRMVIEEVEEDSEDDEIEAIEVDKKPVVNGFGIHHDETVGQVASNTSPDDISPIAAKSKSSQKVTEISEKESSAEKSHTPVTVSSDDPQKGNQSAACQDDSSTTQCSAKSSVEAATSLHETSFESALSQESTSGESQTSVSPKSTSNSSSLSQTSPESSSQIPSSSTPAATESHSLPPVSSDKEEKTVEADQTSCTVSNTFERPTYFQPALPSQVLAEKEEGNKFFRSGQYGEAAIQYAKAISKLEKESDHHVNLSVLLSNRAACHLKTGNCADAVKDCCRSLELVPHQAKALLRRAAANETLEKYEDAYVDYRHALSIDSTTLQANQGASRCQSILQQRYGQASWREKTKKLVLVQPWEVPLIVNKANPSKSLLSEKKAESSSLCQPDEKKDVPPPEKNSDESVNKSQQVDELKKEKILSKEEKFEALKTKGNHHVQKGNFEEAASFYSECITLCPDQVAVFTNRALCYLKLNKAAEAESDCNQALSLQSTNPKALYRRALARKSLQQYKQSLQDLIDLLRLEPKNTAAIKEMESLKSLYKEELEKMKQKMSAAPESDTKLRKRMKIEEVDDEEEEEKPLRGKSGEKSKAQGKNRGGKSSQPLAGVKSKGGSSEKKRATASPQSPPVAPPIAPRLMKTTPYEFCQAWNSLKPCQGVQPYAEILRQIPPVDLPTVISNKLDGQMLQIIVRCVYEEMVLKGEGDQGYQILDNLCKVPRFSTVSMFMTSKEKKEVGGVLDILSKTSSGVYSSADILRLKKEYSVK